MSIADDFAQTDWDVIVVGTGMGGATLGSALARAGKRVLFCEKGWSLLGNSYALRGDFAETYFDHSEAPAAKHADILARAGRCSDTIEDQSGPRVRRFIPFIGSGTGGSTALYGMALERFYPEDFSPRGSYAAVEGVDLPETWPVSYQELRPYYRAAEAIFRVRGGIDRLRADDLDPLMDPPPLGEASRELCEFLQSKGLHPYRLPTACEYVAGCTGCQGFLCARNCKNDSMRICLAPAVEQHGAKLLDQCRVLRLEADRHRVTGVVCVRQGEEFTLRGDIIVLAAGALETPGLLLRSTSSNWPNGLANQSRLVGRNLMRHYVDLYAIFVRAKSGLAAKELAFNDFYSASNGKLGTVQSFGVLPPAPVLVAAMEKDVRDGGMPWLLPAFKLVTPLVRRYLSNRMSRALILASITEDMPHHDNRVALAQDRRNLALQYRIPSADGARIKALRTRLGEVFRPYRFMLIKQAENNERIAHVCGTCRFGADPRTSVVDPNNKAHGVSNLYVVDSSFFPTSAGINPALTIAANALRVAERILRS